MRRVAAYLYLSGAVGALLNLSACRSASNSGAKDDLSDAIAAKLDPTGQAIYAFVAADSIDAYLLPATPAEPIPTTMDGVWWEDTPNGHKLYSFHNANWDVPSRTASLLFLGVGSYSQSVAELPPALAVNGAKANPGRLSGIDFVFSDDKNAKLDDAYTDFDRRQVERKGAYLKWVEDGHWLSHAPNQADTHWLRILKADGSKDKAYATYLQRVTPAAQIMVVMVPPVVSGLDNPLTLKMPVGPAEVAVKLALQWEDTPRPVILTVDAPFPVRLKTSAAGYPGFSDLDGKHVVGMVGFDGLNLIISKAAADSGNVTVVGNWQPQLLVNADHPNVTVTIPPKQIYVAQITGSSTPPSPSGFVEITADPPVTFNVLSSQLAPPLPGASSGLSSPANIYYITNNGDKPLTETFIFHQLPITKTDRGTITVGGPAVRGTLKSASEMDTYAIALPPGSNGSVLIINKLEQAQCCTLAWTYSSESSLNDAASYGAASDMVTQIGEGDRMVVSVAGLYPPGKGPWTYATKVVPAPDGNRFYCTSNQGKGLTPAQRCGFQSDKCSTEHDAEIDADFSCTIR